MCQREAHAGCVQAGRLQRHNPGVWRLARGFLSDVARALASPCNNEETRIHAGQGRVPERTPCAHRSQGSLVSDEEREGVAAVVNASKAFSKA